MWGIPLVVPDLGKAQHDCETHPALYRSRVFLVWLCHSLFSHLLADGAFGLFLSWGLGIRLHLQCWHKSFCGRTHFLWGKYASVGTCRLQGRFLISFIRKCQLLKPQNYSNSPCPCITHSTHPLPWTILGTTGFDYFKLLFWWDGLSRRPLCISDDAFIY